MISKRRKAIDELVRRLGFIQLAKGYSCDAGLSILLGEAPSFGEDDPLAAIAIAVGGDEPETTGGLVRTRTTFEIHAMVRADMDAPLLALEALIADVKAAVEIEGRDQNQLLGGDASIDRSLDGVTLPKGFERGPIRPLNREAGSTFVGAVCEYIGTFEERWGGEPEEEPT
jgi:hypothetical protein